MDIPRSSDSRAFWHRQRMFLAGTAFLIGLAISQLSVIFIDMKGAALSRPGDFPGFYVLGEILRSKQVEQLYDIELQSDLENSHWPMPDRGLYISVYPPYDAVLLLPLAYLSPNAAQATFILFMLGCFALSLHLLTRVNVNLKSDIYTIGALTLFFYCMRSAIFSSQNTALSMLLYALILFGAKKNNRSGDVILGVASGLWMYKPQFGVFAVTLSILLCRRRWVLLSAGAICLVYFAIGSLLMGLDWPVTWLAAVQSFAGMNFRNNGFQMTSIFAASRRLMDTGLIPPSSNGWVIDGVVVLLALSFLFWFIIPALRMGSSNMKILFTLITLGPIISILSPQMIFYDFGIILVSALSVLSLDGDADVWKMFAFVALGEICPLIEHFTPIPPYFFLSILLTIWIRSRLCEIAAPNEA